MNFKKLCKKVLAFSLATVLAATSFVVSDFTLNSAKAQDTASATIDLFPANRVLVNQIGDMFDFSAEYFDANGYLKDEFVEILGFTVKNATFVEFGIDTTMKGRLTDGVVDIETFGCERYNFAHTCSIVKTDENGRIQLLKYGTDYKTEIVGDVTTADKITVKLIGMGKFSGSFEQEIDMFDYIEKFTFINASCAKYFVSKLYEEKKAVEFSLSKDGPFVSGEDFIKANANNMINAGEYDVFYKSVMKQNVVQKGRIIVGKYKIKDSEIVWDVKPLVKYEYDKNKKAPKVSKIVLSKSNALIGAKDITDTKDFTYIYMTLSPQGKVNRTKSCVEVGKYATRVSLDEKTSANYTLPYYFKDSMLMNGILPFDIIKTKTSIASAKATVKKATYNKANQKAVVSKVTLGGKTLKAGTDYTVASVVKKNAGTYNVKITGIGNYKGSFNAKFVIAKKSIAKCKSYIKSRITADGNTILNRGKDYKEVVKKNKMYLVGMGNYTGAKLVNTIKSTKKK